VFFVADLPYQYLRKGANQTVYYLQPGAPSAGDGALSISVVCQTEPATSREIKKKATLTPGVLLKIALHPHLFELSASGLDLLKAMVCAANGSFALARSPLANCSRTSSPILPFRATSPSEFFAAPNRPRPAGPLQLYRPAGSAPLVGPPIPLSTFGRKISPKCFRRSGESKLRPGQASRGPLTQPGPANSKAV